MEMQALEILKGGHTLPLFQLGGCIEQDEGERICLFLFGISRPARAAG